MGEQKRDPVAAAGQTQLPALWRWPGLSILIAVLGASLGVLVMLKATPFQFFAVPFLLVVAAVSITMCVRWRDARAFVFAFTSLWLLAWQGLDMSLRAGMVHPTPAASLVREVMMWMLVPLALAVVASLWNMFERQSDLALAQSALKENEQRYRHLIDHASDGVYQADRAGRFTFANPATARMFGLSLKDFMERSWRDLMPPRAREDMEQALSRQSSKHASVFYHEFPVQRDGQATRWIGQSVQAIAEHGEGKGFQALVRDITDRRVAEDALKASEKRLRSLFETMTEGLIQVAPDGRIVFANPAAQHILGADSKALTARRYDDPAWEFVAPNGSPLPVDEWVVARAAREKKAFKNQLLGVRRPGGGTVWINTNAVPLAAENGEGQGIVATFADVSETRRVEETLRFIEFAVDHAVELVFLVGRKGEIIYANESASRRLGYDEKELLSKTWFDINGKGSAQSWGQVWNQAKQGPLSAFRSTCVSRDGQQFPAMVSASHIEFSGTEYIFAFVHDITRETSLESQLRQAQKMEAIGTLAGGIAHDFNNILSAVLGFTDLAIEDVGEDGEVASYLKEIRDAGLRATDLVKQILTFSRRSDQERRPLRLAPVVKEALKLLRGTLPSSIEIEQDIHKDCGPVTADPGQIHQVIMNLCTNAYHAMRENGGTLTVSMTQVEVEQQEAMSHVDLSAGAYVRLSVEDTGCGMDEETRDRIFEPFFTTKAAGEGTGMGLATVHGIVKGHEGVVEVESASGEGTRFTVFLPLCLQEEDSKAEQVDTAGSVPRGGEHILIVDDEEAITRSVRLSLEKLGYSVKTCTSGVDALEVFLADPQQFDLVITDQAMPRLTGTGLAPRLLAVRPDIPIILCTGFERVLADGNPEALGIRRIMTKPVIAAELARTVREVLDAPAGLFAKGS